MNRFKIIFEKTYTDRCISKKIEHEIVFESALNINNSKELSEFGYEKLKNEYPHFANIQNGLNPAGWTQPQIKEILLLNNSID